MTEEPAQNPVIFLAGPTASGKSAAAIALAEAFDGVVINADSMQIYDTLRVITARPPAEDEARVEHQLYGVLPPSERCSADRWRGLAQAAIADCRSRGKLPILVGGTGLYFRTLEEGLSPIPDVPDEVRAAATAKHAELGGEAFHAELAKRDSVIAARLFPGDTQRMIRAYEVFEATGKPLSEWQQIPPVGGGVGGPLLKLVIAPERALLYERCNLRFDSMMDEGALDEIRDLMAQNLDPALPAMKALGVPELIRHLKGELSLEEAISLSKQSTRRYAKRQLTWMRNQYKADHWIDAQHLQRFAEENFSIIRQFLLTGQP